MEWFGEEWGSPINKMCPKIELPPHSKCIWCGKRFRNSSGVSLELHSDRGTEEVAYFHKHCFDKKISKVQAASLASRSEGSGRAHQVSGWKRKNSKQREASGDIMQFTDLMSYTLGTESDYKRGRPKRVGRTY